MNLSSTLSSQDTSTVDPLGKADVAVWVVITGLISLTGAIGCAFIIAIIVSAKDLCRGSNILIVHYLFLHLFICSINTPILLYMVLCNVYLQVPLGFICPVVHFVHLLVQQASHWAGTLLSLHRLAALRLPYNYACLTQKIPLLFMVLIPWIISLSINIPFLDGSFGRMRLLPSGRCAVGMSSPGLTQISTVLGTYLPLASSLVISLFLLCSINRKTTINECSPMKQSSRRRRTIAKTLVAANFLSALCVVPAALIGSVFPHIHLSYPIVTLWTRTLLPLESAALPVQYHLLLHTINIYFPAINSKLLRLFYRLFSV